MYRALLGFAVGGMVAGATAFWSVYLPAYYLFAATALVPLAVRLMITGQRIDIVMGLMIVAFGTTMSELARRSERWFRSQTELRVRNDILVAHLSEARDLLEHRVADRTAALQETVEQLRVAEAGALRAVEARDQFLAVASHELRTPLTVLTLSLLRVDRQLAAGSLRPARCCREAPPSCGGRCSD
jgi:signal transduction histidine kinase